MTMMTRVVVVVQGVLGSVLYQSGQQVVGGGPSPLAQWPAVLLYCQEYKILLNAIIIEG